MPHVSWRDLRKDRKSYRALRCLALLRRPSPDMCPSATFTENHGSDIEALKVADGAVLCTNSWFLRQTRAHDAEALA